MLQFSTIAVGLWRLPSWEFSARELCEFSQGLVGMGVTTIDLADIYGRYSVEESFGDALRLAPGLRDSLQLVTKCNIKLVSDKRPSHKQHGYDTSYEHIVGSAENSLRALGTDRLDALLIHRQDPLMDPDEVARAFEHLKTSGKVRYFGVSNFSPSHLAMLQSRLEDPLVTNQVEASLLRLDPFTDGTFDQALERRMTPMAWSPLAGGRLMTAESDREIRVLDALRKVGEELGLAPDAVAFAFLASHPARIVPVTGTRSLARVAAALAGAETRLSRDHWFDLWTASTGEALP